MRVSRALLFVVAAFPAVPASAIDWHDPQAVAAAALENNPTILRLQSEVEAARERIAPAASQPNPMVMAGVQNKEIDLGDDAMMTMYMVGARQTFADPARRRARRSIAELEVRAVEQQIASARAEIERDALLAWYDAATADSQIVAAEQVRGLIEAIIDAARVRYEVGNAAQAEVIRAHLERSNLEHLILALRGIRSAALARLLPLLGMPVNTAVPRLHLPHATGRTQIGAPIEPPAGHPALAVLEAEIERQEAVIRLARLATRPDLSVEASYGYRREQRDMFSVVASIELPFRRGSLIEPRIREAVAGREAAERRVEELRRQLTRALAVAAALHEQADQQLRLHEEVLVPQARLAFESTLGSYQTGRASFDGVLAAESTYLRLQLDHYEFLAQHIKAVTDFEAIRKGAVSSALRSPMSSPARGASGPSATTPTMGGM
ncbi:MAG TPA: TolC family protein [Thermoanaerobaculia bacterium]|nr:TolC family protein [Thermoanaerobaculia bacterium]